MLAAARLFGLAGVFVLGANRLDKADRLQIALLLRRAIRQLNKLCLVAQMLGAGDRARRVVQEIVERLVMELEQRIRAVWIGGAGDRVRVADAAGIRPAGVVDTAIRVGPP